MMKKELVLIEIDDLTDQKVDILRKKKREDEVSEVKENHSETDEKGVSERENLLEKESHSEIDPKEVLTEKEKVSQIDERGNLLVINQNLIEKKNHFLERNSIKIENFQNLTEINQRELILENEKISRS